MKYLVSCVIIGMLCLFSEVTGVWQASGGHSGAGVPTRVGVVGSVVQGTLSQSG